jgi:class 3 adenylate cyclase
MEPTGRTLVSSVLFLDIVGYSTMGTGKQIELKQKFNAALLAALASLDASERVVVDTGDGAAITILGDPERALFVAIAIFDNIGDMRVRGGVNLGPISLTNDINGQRNVIGDGINVAQRIMDFAKEGELLVSRSFQETVALMSQEYLSIFSHEGSRTDKHGRSHEVYAVRQSVRVGRRMAELQGKPGGFRGAPAAGAAASAPAVISDAGPHLLVSAYSEAAMNDALDQLVAGGRRITSQPMRNGAKWYATVDKPEVEGATIAKFGTKHMITGPTRESVELKVTELREFGATLLHDIECIDGVWTAVCEKT